MTMIINVYPNGEIWHVYIVIMPLRWFLVYHSNKGQLSTIFRLTWKWMWSIYSCRIKSEKLTLFCKSWFLNITPVWVVCLWHQLIWLYRKEVREWSDPSSSLIYTRTESYNQTPWPFSWFLVNGGVRRNDVEHGWLAFLLRGLVQTLQTTDTVVYAAGRVEMWGDRWLENEWDT